MKKLLLAGVLLLLGVAPSWAQQPPYGSYTTELTGTIAVSGTYQSVFAASSNGARKSCTIQNKGANNMLAFFGSTQPGASSAKGFIITPNNFITWGLVGGGLTLDAIWIEGTSGDTFEYSSQP
jgi:hypothetical protein